MIPEWAFESLDILGFLARDVSDLCRVKLAYIAFGIHEFVRQWKHEAGYNPFRRGDTARAMLHHIIGAACTHPHQHSRAVACCARQALVAAGHLNA